MRKLENIFDPIQAELDQRVFQGTTPRESTLRFVERTLNKALERRFRQPPSNLIKSLFITGSLTTYQWSATSDLDISLYPNYDLFGDPKTARKQLIAMCIDRLDGTMVPGTTHPIQYFVVPQGTEPEDLYKPGLRSGYEVYEDIWLVPPEKDRVHDIQVEYPQMYMRASDMADKMVQMLEHDPDMARRLFAQIHKKRSQDQQAGLGDFSEGNIVYKFLLHQGLFDRLRSELGVYIAKTAVWPFKKEQPAQAEPVQSPQIRGDVYEPGIQYKWLYDPEMNVILIAAEPKDREEASENWHHMKLWQKMYDDYPSYHTVSGGYIRNGQVLSNPIYTQKGDQMVAEDNLPLHETAWAAIGQWSNGQVVPRENYQKYWEPRPVTASPMDFIQSPSGLLEPQWSGISTVLFADMKGFTELCEREMPQNVTQIVGACMRKAESIVSQSGGISYPSGGDSILAVFSRQGNADAAINAGVELQQQFIHQVWRVGIHTGPVTVGEQIIGDTVNVASRLEGMAVPGHVLISEDTFSESSKEYPADYVGQLDLKGREKPVSAYHLEIPLMSKAGAFNPEDYQDDTIHVIYDFEKDTITLGTKVEAGRLPPANKIIGEYNGTDVTLYNVSQQWLNPKHFRRLWFHSFPDRELDNIFEEKGGEHQKISRWSYRTAFMWIDGEIYVGGGSMHSRLIKDYTRDEFGGDYGAAWEKMENSPILFGHIAEWVADYGDETGLNDEYDEGQFLAVFWSHYMKNQWDVNQMAGYKANALEALNKNGYQGIREVATFEENFEYNDPNGDAWYTGVAITKNSAEPQYVQPYIEELKGEEVHKVEGDCLNPKCNYILSEADKQLIGESGGWWTCPNCDYTYDYYSKKYNEYNPGGWTRTGLTVERMGRLGEEVIERLAELPGVGPITWKADQYNYPIDFVIGDYAVEVKTNHSEAQPRFKLGGRAERETKIQLAASMGLREGLLGVRLNFYTDEADIFFREGFSDTWIGSPKLMHVATIDFSDINPFPSPAMVPPPSELPEDDDDWDEGNLG